METDTISDSEFAREVEALRAQRRISVNRPIIDPDLPDLASAHSSGSTSHDILNSQLASKERVNLRDDGPRTAADGSSDPSSMESQPSRGDLSASRPSRQQFTARRRGTDQSTSATPSPKKASTDSPDKPLSSDPAHLFWVPASMHPEISPADFRKFLSDHAARAVRDARISTSAPHSPVSPTSTSLSSEPPDISLSDRIAALRIQTDSSSVANTSSDLLSRSTSLTRRGSTLRRQYEPEHDLIEEEARLAGAAPKPALTLEELQQLEQIAEETTSSHDAARVRNVLRRNLSLDIRSSESEASTSGTELDEADAPIIVPLPGQILRRAARTKVRKTSLSGDGRAGSRRRVGQGSLDAGDGQRRMDFADVAFAVLERTPSSASERHAEVSSSDEAGDGDRLLSDEQADEILEAYSRNSFISDSDTQRSSVTSLPESERDTTTASAGKASSPSTTPTATPSARGYFDLERSDVHIQQQQPQQQQPQPQTQQLQLEHQQPVYHAPSQPNQQVFQPTPEAFANARIVPVPSSTSPEPSDTAAEAAYGPNEVPWPQTGSFNKSGHITPVPIQRVPSTPSFEKSPSGQGQQGSQYAPKLSPKAIIPPQFTQQLQPPLTSPSGVSPPLGGKTKEKEKKGGFGLSWFGLGKDEEEKSSKKKEKEKEKDSAESSNFLSNLFSKKKNTEEGIVGGNHASGPVQRVQLGGPQITAGSLLDRQAQGLSTMGPNRYPIHIERAVYRLSHIKLANPRRPLYEQVLISNLMFWYLSIINKNQQAQQQQRVQQQQQQQQQTEPQQKNAQPGQSPQAQSQQQQQSLSAAQLSPSQQAQGESGGAGASLGQANGLAAEADGPNGKIAPSPQPNGFVGAGVDPNQVPENGPLSDPMAGAGSQGQQSLQQQVPAQPTGRAPKGKRGHLTKANRAPPGTRTAAEMPIPAAGYGKQHRQIQDDMTLQRDVQQFQQHKKHNQAHGHHGSSSSDSSRGTGGGGSEFSVGQVIDPRLIGSHRQHGSNQPGQGDSLAATGPQSSSYERRSPQPPLQSLGPDGNNDAASSAARLADVVGRNGSDIWDRNEMESDIYGGVVGTSPPHTSGIMSRASSDNAGGRLGSAFPGSGSPWTTTAPSQPPGTTAADHSWLNSLAHSTPPGPGATSPNQMLHLTASPIGTGEANPKRSRSPASVERRSDPTYVSPTPQSSDTWGINAGMAMKRDRSSDPVEGSRGGDPGISSPGSYSGSSYGQTADYQSRSLSREAASPSSQRSPPGSSQSTRRWQTATASSSRRPTSPPSLPYEMQRSTSLEDTLIQRAGDVAQGQRPPSAGGLSHKSANSQSSTGTMESFMTAIPPGGGTGSSSPGKSRSPSRRTGSAGNGSGVVLEGKGLGGSGFSSSSVLQRNGTDSRGGSEGWTSKSLDLSGTNSTLPVHGSGSVTADVLASINEGSGGGATGGPGIGSISLGGSAASVAMLEAAKLSRERRR